MSVRKRIGRAGVVSWVYDYRDAGGRRRSRQFSTKAEAVAYAAKTGVELAAGVHTPDAASITVAEAAELWLARARRERLEAATILNYAIHVKSHLVPFIGSVRLNRLSVAALTGLRNALLDAGRSPDLARGVLTSLFGIIRAGQRAGLTSINNLPLIERVRQGREVKRPVAPSQEELTALLNAAQSPRDRVLLNLALFAGLRASEIRGLTWADIDLKTKTLHVRRRADRYCKLGPPKSKAGARSIPIGSVLLNALRTWRLACPPGPLELVLPAADGSIETYNNLLRQVFWPLQTRAGITAKNGSPKYGLHALRHAAVSLWIASGFSAKEVQIWAGHSSIQMTFDTYGHLLNASQDKAREEFDRLAVRLVKDGGSAPN
jgi:integrase